MPSKRSAGDLNGKLARLTRVRENVANLVLKLSSPDIVLLQRILIDIDKEETLLFLQEPALTKSERPAGCRLIVQFCELLASTGDF